jgi:hypothetical protein
VVAVRDIVIASALRSGTSVANATTAQAVAEWQQLNGATTNGLSDLEVLDAWSTSSGILGSKISGWATLNTDSTQRIKQAIAATGSVYASLNVPTTISWSSLVWFLPKNASTPVTDHAVALVGWVTQGWIAVSWGELVLIPWSDWRTEAIGAYAVRPNSTQ